MELSKYLADRNLSTRDFAQLARISQTAVANYASGKETRALKVIKRIVRATKGKVRLEDLGTTENGK